MVLLNNILGGVACALVALIFIAGFVVLATVSPIAVSVILGTMITGAIGGAVYHWKYSE